MKPYFSLVAHWIEKSDFSLVAHWIEKSDFSLVAHWKKRYTGIEGKVKRRPTFNYTKIVACMSRVIFIFILNRVSSYIMKGKNNL